MHTEVHLAPPFRHLADGTGRATGEVPSADAALPLLPPHDLGSSRREEAQVTQNKGEQSLVTSAATVQGSKARKSFSAKSLPGKQGKGEGKRFPERYLKIIRHLSEIFRK